MVHNAKVVAADVDADNGVIYAIDTVSSPDDGGQADLISPQLP